MHKVALSKIVLMLLCLALIVSPGSSAAQEAKTDGMLRDRQASVASRFQKLQELLLRLAEMEVAENPERAALLRRAARQSSDQFILEKLKTASNSLETEEFQKAIENQEAATKELGSLLTLLMSEDRSERIRAEKDRIQQMVKDLKRTLNNQRSVRARTENGADLQELKDEQQSVTERGEKIRDQLMENEEKSPSNGTETGDPDGNPKPRDTESNQPSETDSSKEQEPDTEGEGQEPTSDSKQGDGEQSSSANEPTSEKELENPAATDDQATEEKQPKKEKDSDQSESDSTPSSQSPAERPQEDASSDQKASDPQSEQSQSQQSQSQQSQSQQSQSQQPQTPPQPQTPEQKAEQQLQKAIEKMQDAEQALEEAKREDATEQQRAAEEQLREAIDELDKILRQLREEEMQRELARLEARLKKMATMQSKVLEDTIALAATPPTQRNRQTDLKAGELAFDEKKITLEADRAMLLLREEGSSVAFPEVVSQIREDTLRVSKLLNETKVDVVSQGIQRDILAALEEMIAATQKAQRDLEEQRQQEQPPGSPPPSGQSQQPLVESIAELRLIRTMQIRIQKTTNRYSDLITEGSNSGAELLPLLRDLAERQDRLDKITRDIALERNQ